jgi:YVTN family beta-propeller protein
VIDTATNTVVGDPIPTGDFPTDVAISPDGTASQNGASVTVIDTGTDTVTATIGVDPREPDGPPAQVFSHRVAIRPQNDFAYVVLRGSAQVPAQLVPIDIASKTALPGVLLDEPGPPVSRTFGIAIAPDGATAYVTDTGTGVPGTGVDTVIPVDLGDPASPTPEFAERIPITDTDSDTEPTGIEITSTGDTAYVTNQRCAASTVTPIDIRNGANSPGAPILSGTAATCPDGLPGGGSPWGLAITPNSTVYVANAGQDTVTAIDTETNSVVGSPIPAPDGADNVAITPDQAPDAELDVTPAPGCAATMNAAGSTVAFGTIAEFSWDFGDGHTAVTSEPTTTHTDDAPGTYPVTVRATSSGGTSTPDVTPDVFTGHTMSRNADDRARTTATVVVAACTNPGPSPNPPPHPSPHPSPPSPSAQGLAATGAPVSVIALAGLALVAVGVLLARIARRTRDRRG